MEIYIFKVKDFTTILVGQKEGEYFYIQRGDGEKRQYHECSVEWSKLVCKIEKEEIEKITEI